MGNLNKGQSSYLISVLFLFLEIEMWSSVAAVTFGLLLKLVLETQNFARLCVEFMCNLVLYSSQEGYLYQGLPFNFKI